MNSLIICHHRHQHLQIKHNLSINLKKIKHQLNKVNKTSKIQVVDEFFILILLLKNVFYEIISIKNGKLITHHQKVKLFAFLFCDPKYDDNDED